MCKRSLEVTDLFRFTPLSDAQISPDGESVAFMRQYWDFKKDTARTEIWVVPAVGGEPRPFAVGGNQNSAPRWSPDGSRLCFLSDRSGRNQLYVIPRAGGEAAIVATEEEPSSAAWAPDGMTFAFESRAYMAPEVPFYAGAPVDSVVPRPGKDNDREGIRVIKTLRHRSEAAGYYGNWWRHIFLVSSEPTRHGEVAVTRRLTDGRFNHESPVWSPDGLYIACLANRQLPDEGRSFESHLWIYEVSTGRGLRALKENYAVLGPRFSPDGKTLSFVGSRSESIADNLPFSLHTVSFCPDNYPVSWDDARDLTGDMDRDTGNVALWSFDGSSMFTTISDAGRTYILQVPSDGSPGRKELPGGACSRQVSSISLSLCGRLAYLSQSPVEPGDVYTLSPDGTETRLTSLNADIAAEFNMVKPERMLYRAPDGWEIEGWYMKPVGYQAGERYPAVLSIHGGPIGMYGYTFAFEFQYLVNHGFAVIFLNPRGSSGYGYTFQHAAVCDWGGKDFVDLMTGVDRAVDTGSIDPDRLGVMGWSYGGFMTSWVVTHTARFKAAVAGASITDQVSMFGTSDVGFEFTRVSMGSNPWEDPGPLLAHSPVRFTANVTTPLLILHGERDCRCPVTQSEEMFAALQAQDKTSVFVRYPGEGHGFKSPTHIADRWERTLAWFQHYLRGSAASRRSTSSSVQ